MMQSRYALALLAAAVVAVPGAKADAETIMYGGTPSRNMVSDETGVPDDWDPETGRNIKWVATLGSQTYAGPVVLGGKVFVGTNNEAKRNPEIKGDKGVIMVFDSETGDFLWQAIHDKLPAGRVNDWPLQGICSTPVVDGDRLYYVSNRAEVVCADTEGFRDGENDGPFKDEADTGKEAADIIWSYDLIGELDAFPHNLAVSSPVMAGNIIFSITGNGVDEGHINNPSPFAPSFVAHDKRTGKLLWENADPGEAILHGSWANAAYGKVKGKPQVVFPGGDGWAYAFEPETGELIWKFDLNPKDSVWELGGSGSRNNIISTPVIYKDLVYLAVGQDPEHGEGEGHLFAIDASMTGDITDKAVVWHVGGEDYNRTMSTVAIKDGLLYAADLSGFLYCMELDTGKVLWTYEAFAAVWTSPYVVDGKIYLTDEDGDVAILKEGRKMELIREINMGTAVYTTPFAKDGVLYLASRTKLFAIEVGKGKKKEKAQSKPAKKK